MAVTGNTTSVSWVRPEIATLHGALTHYMVVYNRTILSGETGPSHFTTNSEQVPAGSDPTQTNFSYQIMGLTAGSRYEISIEPCRMAVCGPAATTSTNTSNAGKSDCVQSALGTIRDIHAVFLLELEQADESCAASVVTFTYTSYKMNMSRVCA